MIGKTSFLFHSLIKYLIDTRHSANKSLFSHCVCNYFCIKLEYIQSPDWESSAAAAAAASLQSCPTLCDPIEGSPAGSPVPGILQARTPEWVALSFSNAWKWNETTTTTIDVQVSEHAMRDSRLISLFLFSLILHSLLKIVGTPRGQIISFSSLLSSLFFFPLWPQLNFYQGYISSSACTKDHFEVHMLPAIMSEVPICYQWVSVSWIPPYR